MKITHLLIAGLLLTTITACGGIEYSSSGIPRVKQTGTRFELQNTYLSPDGRYVQFRYGDRSKKTIGGIGLLDLQTGVLTKLSQPAPWANKDTTEQPSTGSVLVSRDALPPSSKDGKYMQYLVWMDRENRQRLLSRQPYTTGSVALPVELGFQQISKPQFINENTVLFAAYNPVDPELAQRAKALGTDTFSTLFYRWEIGKKPEFLSEQINNMLAEIKRKSANSRGFSVFPSVGRTRFTPNGEKIIFTSQSYTQPKTDKGVFNYELYLLENGRVSQLTDLRGRMCCNNISDDGNWVSFGADLNHGISHDLYVMDLRTRQLYPTKIAERMDADPAFAPVEK